MSGWAVLVLALTGLVIAAFVIALWRQGFPSTGGASEESVSDEGPTTAAYPPGSRPAGPGAESMNVPPSKSMREGTENHT